MAIEFVVPESGTYHCAGGREPHLVTECTAACRRLGAISIGLDTTTVSMVVTDVETARADDLETTFVAWEEYPRDDRPAS